MSLLNLGVCTIMAGRPRKVKNSKIFDTSQSEDPFFDFYSDQMDQLTKDYKLSGSGLLIPDRLSTGLLTTDLMLNGGLGAGAMFTFSGPEASSKTTLVSTVLSSAVKSNIFINLHDAENSVDPVYTTNIFGVEKLSDIFGKRGIDGKWLKRPKIHYFDDNILETFFNMTRDFLKRLPDKRYLPENDTWYLVFEATRDGVKDKINAMGLKIDQALYKETGKYWCLTVKRGPQAIITCDSWPSLLTAGEDEEGEERSKAMAINARKFSQYLPQVVGKLRRKGIILIGVNQIRENPGVMYGSKYYEPCGQALKFFSSVRLQLFARSTPHNTKEAIEKETSAWVANAEDHYAYKFIKNTKNKQGTPFLETWVRVWVRDAQGQGRGYCPTWDCYQYLLQTGRVDGKRNKFKLSFPGLNTQKQITWLDFKKFTQASTKEQRLQSAKLFGITKWFDLRQACFDEIKSGVGLKKYYEGMKKGKVALEDLEE